MRMTPDELIIELTSQIDSTIARAAIESYIDMQQRFLAGDHGPAELDGGRLCEAVSRGVLQLDSGIINHRKLPAEIRTHLLDHSKTHRLSSTDRNHISKAIEVVYKFRSDRGSVHISPFHSPNLMDSMFVMHAGKWILSEFLRLAWTHDRRVVGEVIAQLVQLEHAMIHELDGRPMVLVSTISIPEEILLLLNHAPGNRLTRPEIAEYTFQRSSKTIATAISRLLNTKEVRVGSIGDISLTPLGQKRITEIILPKYRM